MATKLYGLLMLIYGCLTHSTWAEEMPVSTRLLALSSTTAAETITAPNPYDLRSAFLTLDAEGIFWRDKIYTILQQHRRVDSRDPAYLLNDMAVMADYFARYPSVRELFAAIKGKRWHWQHGDHQAETRVEGSRLQVRSLNIRFDSRAGAQFQFRNACAHKIPYCFAAPADVFLHELLHVHAILTNPDTFIAQGGMGEHLYPHLHERDTIAAERRLYTLMSSLDNFPRPLRASHSGRRTTTQCATCLR